MGDEEFSGMPREERDELLAQRKKRRIITAVIIGVLFLSLIIAIIGLVIIVDVRSDDDKGTGNTNTAASPTPSITPSVTPSVTPSLVSVNGTVAKGQTNVNKQYFSASSNSESEEQFIAFAHSIFKFFFDWFHMIHN